MDAIDLIAKRISALELAVFPNGEYVKPDKSQPEITDLLLQTHSMTVTALSCREVVTSILKRMETINDYLLPDYCDNQLDIQDKHQYILELYPEMKKTLKLLEEFEQLKAFLDSPPINNIPSLVDQLENLTLDNISTYQECKSLTDKILRALQQYSDITMSIKILFAQLEQSITNIEISLQPKPTIDE